MPKEFLKPNYVTNFMKDAEDDLFEALDKKNKKLILKGVRDVKQRI